MRDNKRKTGTIFLAGLLAAAMVMGACGNSAGNGTSTESATAENAGAAETVNGGISETEPGMETASTTVEKETNEEAEPVSADIVVEKVPGITSDFIRGADLSSYISLKESGVQFYDYEGNALDDQGFFDFLADCGMNYVRVRIWNDPTDENGRTYGGGHCDVEVAKQIGTYATKAGMKVLLDYHLSDFWTNPGKQNAPKAWNGYSPEQKAEAVKSFISESLDDLLKQDINIGMVQVGNENTDGIAGEHKWENMCLLFQAGSEAVRETAAANGKEILVAIHFTNPEKGSYPEYAAYLQKYNVDYDVFGSSYYPYWHGTPEDLTASLKDIAETYGKKVAILETSYASTYLDGDGHPNTESEGKAGDKFYYSVDEQGQADAIRTAANAVASVGDAGLGFFWWEPAWIPVQVYPTKENFELFNRRGLNTEGLTLEEYLADADTILQNNKTAWEEKGSGWAASSAGDYDADAKDWYGGSAVDNEAIFDFWGHPLSSARIFSYIWTGTEAPLKVTSVITDEIKLDVNSSLNIPDACYVTYNDGYKERAAISWEEADVAAVDMSVAGEYLLHGSVNPEKLMHLRNASGAVNTDGMEEILSGAVAKVIVKSVNLLANPGFEEEDMSMWEISSPVIARKNDGNNVHDGDYCLHFWDSGAVEYTVEQKVTLNKGIYTLGAYLEGGDAGADAVFTLYAVVDGQEYKTETGVTKWQEWKNPEVTGISVPADGTEVIIGIYGKCAPGGWGAWDDFYLNQN